MRMDPPPSLPVAKGHKYAATAAAAPPLDPPGVRSVFQGLHPVIPKLFSHVPTMPNSGTLVLPKMMPPAARTRSTTAESRSGIRSLNTTEPEVVRIPLVIWVSLMGIGSPCRVPSSSPRITAASAAFAVSIASSWVKSRNAFSCESSLSMRSKYSSVSSTGEICFVEINFKRSVAEAKVNPSSTMVSPFSTYGKYSEAFNPYSL